MKNRILAARKQSPRLTFLSMYYGMAEIQKTPVPGGNIYTAILYEHDRTLYLTTISLKNCLTFLKNNVA